MKLPWRYRVSCEFFFEEISDGAKFIPDEGDTGIPSDQLFTPPIPSRTAKDGARPLPKKSSVFFFLPGVLAGSLVNRFVNIGNKQTSEAMDFFFSKWPGCWGFDPSFPISLKICLSFSQAMILFLEHCLAFGGIVLLVMVPNCVT